MKEPLISVIVPIYKIDRYLGILNRELAEPDTLQS